MSHEGLIRSRRACAMLLAAATACARAPQPPDAGTGARGAEGPAEACLLGRLDIVWNHEIRFFVTADDGTEAEVLIAETRLREAGGPLGINGQRVRALGGWSDAERRVLRADSLEVSPPEDASCP